MGVERCVRRLPVHTALLPIKDPHGMVRQVCVVWWVLVPLRGMRLALTLAVRPIRATMLIHVPVEEAAHVWELREWV